jgi:hypothetical protein
MRVLLPALAVFVCTSVTAQSGADPKLSDPKLVSIHPFTGQRGTTFTATLRGSGLAGAANATIGDAPFVVTVDKVEAEPVAEGASKNKTLVDLVTIRVQVAEGAKPGKYPIRLITRNGLTNSLPLQIVDVPVKLEPDGTHESQESAVAVPSVPAMFSGRLSRRGEADYYSFSVQAGQTLTFGVISGLPQIASAGSAATVANFDPALSIFEAEGSWFDSKRLKRIAYNDEPVWVFGKPTDVHLVQKFAKAGAYLLRVEAFAGQGGPDYSYQLAIAPGAVPEEAASRPSGWQERTWARRLPADRLNQLAARGGKPEDKKSIETYRATGPEAAVFKLPGTVEGTLSKPGETHRARFQVNEPADIAMEVETPAAAPPFFNPIVRLLNSSGQEVATNVFAGRGACSGALNKSAQAKTIVPLRDPGEYTLEVRDATADLAGADFQYRVQVRPQVPHIGDVRIDTDHVNLTPGEAKLIRVVFDREEDYRGSVTVMAESLPPGVSAAVGADYEPDKDPPSATGKRERYTPRTERAVLVLSASADAAPAVQPQKARLVVRPLVDGKSGAVLSTKTIYVMVTEKP